MPESGQGTVQISMVNVDRGDVWPAGLSHRMTQECMRGALKDKTIIRVTHQVDFLHNADEILASSDQINLDLFLPFFGGLTIAMYITVLSIIIVTCQVSWPTIFVIIPLALLNFWYRGYYLSTSREITRLDSITKAPVIHHFSESVAGVMTIRCFRKQPQFTEENMYRVNANLRMDFHNNGSNEWLGFRLELVGSFILCLSALFMVSLPSNWIKPGSIQEWTSFLRDTQAGDSQLKLLWHHSDAIMCCSIKANVPPVFTFAIKRGSTCWKPRLLRYKI